MGRKGQKERERARGIRSRGRIERVWQVGSPLIEPNRGKEGLTPAREADIGPELIGRRAKVSQKRGRARSTLRKLRPQTSRTYKTEPND